MDIGYTPNHVIFYVHFIIFALYLFCIIFSFMEEKLTLNDAFQRSYSRIRNKLWTNHYKPFVEEDEEEGNKEGKAKARVIVPKDEANKAWPMN
jgi:hypothetical protein